MSVADIRRRFERKGSVSQMRQLQQEDHHQSHDIAEMQAIFSSGGAVSVSNLRRLFETSKRNSREAMNEATASSSASATSNSTSAASTTQGPLSTIDEHDDSSAAGTNKPAEATTTQQQTQQQSQSQDASLHDDKTGAETEAANDSATGAAGEGAQVDNPNSGDNTENRDNEQQEDRPRRQRSQQSSAGHIAFTRDEIIALKLMFTLLDLSGDGYIELDEFIAFAEESGEFLSPHTNCDR